jgi:folate-binding protein YgfZ
MVKLMRIPAYDWHQQKGALFEDYFGCEVPSHYGNFEKEYRQLREEFVVRDVSHFGKIRVTGRDRARFLQGMLTNDIKALETGKGTFALFLDVKGHIHADMKVYAFPDHLLLVLQHYLVQKLMTGLDRYIMSEDVRMQDVTADLAMTQVLGPKSADYVHSKGLGGQIPDSPYHHRSVSVEGLEFSLIRLPSGFAFLQSGGTELPQTALLDFLAGPLIGAKAFEVFRIESGIPLMQKDMDETNFPQECGLDQALDFQKGCYLGQETMARIDAQGHVNRHLIGIVATAPVAPGDKIFRESKEVGRITSATDSLMLRQPFALGFIRREFSKEGERIEIGTHNTTGIVRNLPLNP